MQTPFAAEFKFMLFVNPTDGPVEMMDNLAFLQNAEWIGSDVGVVAALIRGSVSIYGDGRKSAETVIQV